MGQAPRVQKKLPFPLIVKSLTQEASIGISQASIVEDEAALRERVRFIHQSIGTDAIVERYIDGRELYVGVLGNVRLQVLPVWEMNFAQMPDRAHRIASERVKWNDAYREKHGIMTGPADLPPALAQRIQHLCKRVYRTLDLSGYARIDLRLDAEGRVLRARSQPQPAAGVRRRLRRGGGARGHHVRSAPAAHSRPRAPLAAGAGGLNARFQSSQCSLLRALSSARGRRSAEPAQQRGSAASN